MARHISSSLQIERQYAGLAQEFRADFRLEDGAIGEIGRADDRKTKLAGGRLGNVLFAGEAEIGEHHLEPVVGFGTHAESALNRRCIQLFTVQQALDERAFECLSIWQD